MKIRFIKVAKYGTKISVDQKYQYYCRSSTQQADPDVELPISYVSQYHLGQYQSIYSSPLRRAISSAKYLSSDVVVKGELREVRFDLAKLVTPGEYIKYGSSLVRDRFVQAFIQDKLMEPRKEIIDRVKILMAYLRQSKSIDTICVSHSFLMKIIEAYIARVDLLHDPTRLAEFITPMTKTYPYGGGFIIRVQSTRGVI